MAAAIIFAALSALSNACSAVLQRLAAVQQSTTGKSMWKTAIDLVRQPIWLLGALFLVGTFAFSALALYFGPLAVVQPVLVLELIFTLGLRVFFLHDSIAARTWSAALFICVGLGAFLVVASPTDGGHVPTAAQWIVAVTTRSAAVAVLLLFSRRGSPAARAAFFGAATAVVWSLDAAFVKETVDQLARSGLWDLVLHWPLYAMIATGVIGTILLQGAFRVGPLAASQATMLIVDPLTSIGLGIELFHEQLNTGPGDVAGAVLSLAVLAGGVIALSVWAPPVMTADELAQLRGHPVGTEQSGAKEGPD
jgi:drug/metabolite transporter (DMT)-like permease